MKAARCLFSGQAPDNEEHVIPDWLQRRFGLQRQTYHLPSNTGLDYRHAKVAANRHHNHQFGQIEDRISRNRYVWEEVYLRLFKIHIGLMVRNVSLRADLRDPSSKFIIPSRIIESQLRIFCELYKKYFDGNCFQTNSSPPGSVFILPSLTPKQFDFVHSFTCGCIGVNVGDYFLAASLWDFGMAKEWGYFDWAWGKDGFGTPPDHLNEEERRAFYQHAQTIWLCNLGYWCLRWNINMYRITVNYQPDLPAFEGEAHQRPESPEELAHVCKTFGIELVEFVRDGKSYFSPATGRARNI